MKIRFGYVASALNLEGITSSGVLTFTRYKRLSEEERINELKRVTRTNIKALEKILKYNADKHIHFYRITSKLIPLASHPEVTDWKYKDIFYKDFSDIGKFIKRHHMRVDTHPDHFNVINSLKENVLIATIRELKYHEDIFEMLDYPEGKMILHIGSAQGGKEKSIERLINNFYKVPQNIRSKIILENDDRTFNISETLTACKHLNIPMVLDYHHYLCNKGGYVLERYIREILNTWNEQLLPPKAHISGPRDEKNITRHADYLEPDIFFDFLKILQTEKRDVDIMIESKQKDKALLKLVEDIKAINPKIKWTDETTIEV